MHVSAWQTLHSSGLSLEPASAVTPCLTALPSATLTATRNQHVLHRTALPHCKHLLHTYLGRHRSVHLLSLILLG